MNGSTAACRRGALLVVMIAALAVFATGASLAAAAPKQAGPPVASFPGSSRPLTALPVTPAALADTIRQATGHPPAHLTRRQACGFPTPGPVECLAEVVVSKDTGVPTAPRLPPAAAVEASNLSAHIALGPTNPLAPTVPISRMFDLRPSPAVEPAAETGMPPPKVGSPAFFQRAYDLQYLSAHRGANDRIAIVDAFDDPHAAADLAVFRQRFGLPPCTVDDGCFKRVNQFGQTSDYPPVDPTGNWELEESLDVDAASAVCPLCHITLVETNKTSLDDLATGIRTAAHGGAKQISLSLSAATTTQKPGQWTYPGVSTLAASGDSGYAGTDTVRFPAGHPEVTAVGGTELAAAQNPRGVAESAWSGSGSGCAPGIPKPAFQHGLGSCPGRSVAGVSAVAWGSGLDVYDSTPFDGSVGWFVAAGTSLATPMTAGFLALTGIDTTGTGAWPYVNAKHLNDIVSGNNDSGADDPSGRCKPEIAYICHAGPGYDGPTGVGSISGAVVPGGPGIGGTFDEAVTGDSALVTGGIYPNQRPTTYRIEYGRTASYGDQTERLSVGTGAALVPVQVRLQGLMPDTRYHYRLVATNSFGTDDGYDGTFTTTSGGGGGGPAPKATPRIATTPKLVGRARVGGVVRLTGGRYENGSPSRVRFYRCARRCSLLKSSAAVSYRLPKRAAGFLVRANVEVSGNGKRASAQAQPYLGPVSSRSVGATRIAIGRRARAGTVAVRSASHRQLARVRMASVRGTIILTVLPGKRTTTVRAFVLSGGRFVFHGAHKGKTLAFAVKRGEKVAVAAVGGK